MLLIGGGGDTDTFIGHGGGSGFIKLQEVSDEDVIIEGDTLTESGAVFKMAF